MSRIDVSKARGHGGEHPAAGKLTPNQRLICCIKAAWPWGRASKRQLC